MKPLIILTLMAATPALADCPVAADLATGVRVTESDGTINLFSALGDGIVMNDGTATSGYTYRNVLAQGTHLVELGDTENGVYVDGTKSTVVYPVSRADMPIPTPNTRAEYLTTIQAAGGDYPETQQQVWGNITTLDIGDCTYDMIPGKLTYTNESYVVLEGLYYLPALELGLLHSYQIQGEPADIYVATKIEAVE